jgi:hypothetical protein
MICSVTGVWASAPPQKLLLISPELVTKVTPTTQHPQTQPPSQPPSNAPPWVHTPTKFSKGVATSLRLRVWGAGLNPNS